MKPLRSVSIAGVLGCVAALIAGGAFASLAAQIAQYPVQLSRPGAAAPNLLATFLRGEIKTADLMSHKGQNPQTRAFARQTAALYARQWSALRKLAGNSNWNLKEVPELKQEWQNFRSELRNQAGATADRDYLRGEADVARNASLALLPSLAATTPRLTSFLTGLRRLLAMQQAETRRAQAALTDAFSTGVGSQGVLPGDYHPR